MATCRIYRTSHMILLCMGSSVFFSFLGFGAFILMRGICLELGIRWSVLASMGGMMVLALASTFAGATVGVIVGKKHACPEQRVSLCGSLAAFLSGGFGAMAVMYGTYLLGMVEGIKQILSFLLAFLIVMPLFSVMSYDAVAKMRRTGSANMKGEDQGEPLR